MSAQRQKINLDRLVYLGFSTYLCGMKSSSIRQHIIETASRLFYEQGYNLTGINEVIKEAEIAKATLYNHFKSKEDICLAYLNHKNDGLLIELQAYVEQFDTGATQILALFDFLKLFFKDKHFNGCWCINTISEIPRDNVRIRKEIQRQKTQFKDLIERLIKTNLPQLDARKTADMAKQIYLLYETAVAESHLHQKPWPISSAKDIAQLILQQ